MDNFLLQAIVAELESVLVGQRLAKVYQRGSTDLAIDFRSRDGRWLVVSTDPQRLAFYLTSHSPKQRGEDLRADTPFVSLLKKHLGGARLLAIEKTGYDRVVSFEFAANDKDSETERLTLVILLTGRAANILLLEQSQVIASLREREEAIKTFVYPPPPADKLDPFLCSPEKLDDLIVMSKGDLADAAQQYLIGFSKIYASELAFRADQTNPHEALQNLLADLYESPPTPTIYSTRPLGEVKREIGSIDFNLILTPIELGHLSVLNRSSYSSVNEAADEYFTLLDERRSFVALKQRLNSHIASQIKKQRSLITNLKREREGCSNAETHQRYGDLLLANVHQAVKTENGFAITDFFDEAQKRIEVPSANKTTPQEAAEHYFKLARKARHGLERIDARLPEIERELAKLETQSAQLASLTRLEELNSLAEKFGLTISRPEKEKRENRPKKSKEEKLAGVRRYRSSEGYEILVGRTDRDNDRLTFRIANSYDLWFHAADYPGSHVVLRNPQRKQIPPKAVTEAAQLAAKFSQARENTKVAVHYCEKKFVSKVKGFAPGQVRLSSFKTILVEPHEAGERIL